MADPKGNASSNSSSSFELHRELRNDREQCAASREILAAQSFLLEGGTFRLSQVAGETPWG